MVVKATVFLLLALLQLPAMVQPSAIQGSFTVEDISVLLPADTEVVEHLKSSSAYTAVLLRRKDDKKSKLYGIANTGLLGNRESRFELLVESESESIKKQPLSAPGVNNLSSSRGMLTVGNRSLYFATVGIVPFLFGPGSSPGALSAWRLKDFKTLEPIAELGDKVKVALPSGNTEGVIKWLSSAFPSPSGNREAIFLGLQLPTGNICGIFEILAKDSFSLVADLTYMGNGARNFFSEFDTDAQYLGFVSENRVVYKAVPKQDCGIAAVSLDTRQETCVAPWVASLFGEAGASTVISTPAVNKDNAETYLSYIIAKANHDWFTRIARWDGQNLEQMFRVEDWAGQLGSPLQVTHIAAGRGIKLLGMQFYKDAEPAYIHALAIAREDNQWTTLVKRGNAMPGGKIAAYLNPRYTAFGCSGLFSTIKDSQYGPFDALYLVKAPCAISGPVPAITSAGAVNAASFAPGLSPGALFTVFGQNLATKETLASALPLPRELAGTKLLANGHECPLLYAGPTQINAQMPFGLPVPSAIKLQVVSSGLAGNEVTVPMAATAPGVFRFDPAGDGKILLGNATHADYRAAAPGDPLSRGETGILWTTGLGPTTVTYAEGESAPAGAVALALPKLVIGGKDAVVLYAGAAQGFAGLFQINFVVPEDAAVGEPFTSAVLSTPDGQDKFVLAIK